MAILYSRLFSLVQITSHLGKIYSELLYKVRMWVAIVILVELRAYIIPIDKCTCRELKTEVAG